MENVQNIYPLSPMQEMMLLHALGNPATDTLFSQFCYELKGSLNVDAFTGAWQILVDRHDALRTQFAWRDLKRPMQIVRTKLSLPYEFLDFSDVLEHERRERVDAFLHADRQQGFSAEQAPMLRIALLKVAKDKHLFVWSSHHLVLDRWCISTLLEELQSILAQPALTQPIVAQRSAERLPPAVPFGNYIGWIAQQQQQVTNTYWQTYLAGYQPAPMLVIGPRKDASEAPPEVAVGLDAQLVQQLQRCAQQCAVTLNTLMQFGLALTINQFTGKQDLVFGTATSGRPPELLDVERIVGSFVANVPTRVRLPQDVLISEILEVMQRDSQERLRHEYAATPELIRNVAPVASGGLFDVLIIWLGSARSIQLPGISTREHAGRLETAYPVTLGIAEVEGALRLTARAQPGIDLVVSLDRMLNEFARVLAVLSQADLSVSISEFPGFKGELTQATFALVPSTANHGVDRSTAATGPAAGREASDSQMLRELVEGGWQQVLGILPGRADIDFFSAGGDSQSALKLHLLLESATRLEIPLLSLFQGPTVSEMVEFLARPAWGLKPQVLVPLRADGSQAPLFFVASPEVNTLGYTLLTRHLGKEVPVYLLQALPQMETVDRLAVTELPQLAAEYVAKLRLVQPSGPYRLLGMCSGAQITHEMALLLEQAGEQAEFVGVVNTWSHFTVARTYVMHRWVNRIRWYGERFQQLWNLDSDSRRRTIRRLLTRRIPALALDQGVQESGASTATIAEQASIAVQHSDPWIDEFGWVDAPAAQAVRKSAAPYTIFRIRKQPFWRTGQKDLGWGMFSQGAIDVVDLQTQQHADIMREPHVRLLAKALQEKLDGK